MRFKEKTTAREKKKLRRKTAKARHKKWVGDSKNISSKCCKVRGV